ncbi:MAG: hypothetical protein HOO96_18925 [Polyangiaceae bacterium]|nr:hypothetical protein [Polyangiaceae bacterium]
MTQSTWARALAVMGLSLALAQAGCAASSDQTAPDENEDLDLTTGKPRTALGWNFWFKRRYPDWYTTSARSELDARAWGGGFEPASDPVLAHNDIFMDGVGPKQVLAQMVRASEWQTFYENSGPALLPSGEPVARLTLGLEYRWTTFSVSQKMKVVELSEGEQESILAWQGGSVGTEVYHRWIFRREGAGTRVVTEELERGFAPRLDRMLMNPSLHCGHELWLRGLARKMAAR